MAIWPCSRASRRLANRRARYEGVERAMKFTAIDFETANSDRSSACAVGLVTVEGGEIVRRVRHLIRPDPLVFDRFCVEIHGITARDVADAPTFGEIWPSLWAAVSGPLVAHNAAFDMSVLRKSLDKLGGNYPDSDYFCTLAISRIVWPQLATHKLNIIASHLGITFRHHDAAEDAEASALIAISACRHNRVACLYDLQEIIGCRAGRLASPRRGDRPATTASRPRSNNALWGLRAADVLPSTNGIDADSPCFGRSFVFTGELSSMKRREAMQQVVDRGGACHDAVKRSTDYLVLGQEGFLGYQAGHKSTKIRKAEAQQAKGLPISIISEENFLNMLGKKKV
jgi:DNA polymerase-3 subunit epsilon